MEIMMTQDIEISLVLHLIVRKIILASSTNDYHHHHHNNLLTLVCTLLQQLICKCMQTAGICEKDVTILLTWSNSRMAKDMVRANTEEAVNLGAFGAPSFYVQNAPKPFQKPFLLFGSDRFEQLTYILNLKWHGVARQLLHNSKL